LIVGGLEGALVRVGLLVVGRKVGDSEEGVNVGTTVTGEPEGADDGRTDGATVGDSEGHLDDGFKVGEDGDDDKAVLGDADGRSEGNTDGA